MVKLRDLTRDNCDGAVGSVLGRAQETPVSLSDVVFLEANAELAILRDHA